MSGLFARLVAPRLPLFGRLAHRLDAQRMAALEPLLSARRADVERIRVLLRRAGDEPASRPANHGEGDAVALSARAAEIELDAIVDDLLAELHRRASNDAGSLALRAAGAIDRLTRSQRDEILDDPAVSADRRRRAMRGLARLNRQSGAEASWSTAVIDRLGHGAEGPHVYELAAGTGDFARALRRAAQARGVALRVTISDLDERALRPPSDDERAWLSTAVRDARRLDDANADLFLCVQAAHHLPPGDVLRMIDAGLDAPRGVLVIDVYRAAAHTLIAAVGAALFGRNLIVVVDGVRSIRRGFTPAELELLARLADPSATIQAVPLAPAYALLHARRIDA